jgi:hypothetical protein
MFWEPGTTVAQIPVRRWRTKLRFRKPLLSLSVSFCKNHGAKKITDSFIILANMMRKYTQKNIK